MFPNLRGLELPNAEIARVGGHEIFMVNEVSIESRFRQKSYNTTNWSLWATVLLHQI